MHGVLEGGDRQGDVGLEYVLHEGRFEHPAGDVAQNFRTD